MKERATRFPDGFGLESELWLYAAKFGLSPGPTFDHFKDHHLAKGSRFVDWRAAFRTWCRRAQQYGGRIEPASVETPSPRYCATCGHTGSWHKNEVKHGRNPGHEFVLQQDTQEVAQ